MAVVLLISEIVLKLHILPSITVKRWCFIKSNTSVIEPSIALLCVDNRSVESVHLSSKRYSLYIQALSSNHDLSHFLAIFHCNRTKTLFIRQKPDRCKQQNTKNSGTIRPIAFAKKKVFPISFFIFHHCGAKRKEILF